ncbi:hypothetical protein H6F76_07915 [Leptolyngbya sp. FACHB-321]|nr:hypothetical protein [Leptolyngbya sp. FACHB-321]MBD2034955.1 hypothetical protein [Leptolyngbya sp. FACHB-321]
MAAASGRTVGLKMATLIASTGFTGSSNNLILPVNQSFIEANRRSPL